jgi:hypothetical protein
MIDKTICELLRRNISDFYVNLRVEVGKHPQVILVMYFSILDKNNERPDWMTDLKYTDSRFFVLINQCITMVPTLHGKKMHVKEIYVIFIHLFDSC